MDEETKTDHLSYWIEEIQKWLRARGVEIDPLPEVEFDWTENPEDELFVRTGYYEAGSNRLVLFVHNRHIKDILRTFCHEMWHRHQALLDPVGFQQSSVAEPIEQNDRLRELEGDAYLNGNVLFREFTEWFQGNLN